MATATYSPEMGGAVLCHQTGLAVARTTCRGRGSEDCCDSIGETPVCRRKDWQNWPA